MTCVAARVSVTGAAQGVGLRPRIARLARGLRLGGSVCNTLAGVCVEVEGAPGPVDAFVAALGAEVGPTCQWVAEAGPVTGRAAFAILPSALDGAPSPRLPVDTVPCVHCRQELTDPTSRRFGDPFIGCARCGPRYSLLQGWPFDRARTTLATFTPCIQCQSEYDDAEDRRFHAQTVTCPACGPRLTLLDGAGRPLAAAEEALTGALDLLRRGGILAVKGVGGYQLVCDAADDGAVRRLRAGKRRPEKPLAVMVADLAAAHALAELSAEEGAALTAASGPIVLLRRRGEGGLSPWVAPGCPLVGVLLPTSGLHHRLARGAASPLVVTSGNRRGEPMALDAISAVEALGGQVDALLDHDRAIARPLDDSVVRVIAGRATVLRAGRGWAPLALPLPEALATAAPVLAFGGHEKGAIAATVAGHIVLGPHLGDLDTAACLALHSRNRADWAALWPLAGASMVHDLHPDYASTRLAEEAPGAPRRMAVAHHHAHVAACLLEHGEQGPVAALACDGNGLGPDGGLWGGEVLVATCRDLRRVASLRSIPLPGGDAAVGDPRRVAAALLWSLEVPGAAALGIGALPEAEGAMIRQLLDTDLRCPRTSALGRLFDGVAALLGLVGQASYDGQGAMALEWAALRHTSTGGAPWALPTAQREGVRRLDWGPMIGALMAEAAAGAAVGALAWRFHVSIAEALAAEAARTGLKVAALTGGCFQSLILTELTVDALARHGIRALTHGRVPPGDGGLAAGQARIAIEEGR